MDIITGRITNPIAVPQLSEELSSMGLEGTLYLGYPILSGPDETITIDALLISPSTGLVVFHFPKNVGFGAGWWKEIEQTQDDLYVAMKQKLVTHKSLRKGRDLAFDPAVVCYLSSAEKKPTGSKVIVADASILHDVMASLEPIPEEYFRPLISAIQRVSTIRPPKKRTLVKKNDSRGAILRAIEREIANLDTYQNHAAIETPDSPQCIRGIAGSGKTVVLALKAAFLHARNPDWNIAVTFHTRSLYQQLQDLIRRFSFEQTGDEPDWSRLKVIHSWGSRSEPGIYSEVAAAYGIKVKNLQDALSQFGRREAFGGICEELLNVIGSRPPLGLYDAMLVDEGQDFPQSFFQLVYHKGVKDPHRIVWAYDELQNLGDYVWLPAEQLFGVGKNNVPLVTLKNEKGKPRQDITLPICYRNTPWALTVAHALGFGIYRDGGLVQLFEGASEVVWRSLGYQLTSGALEPGSQVRLRRDDDSAPKYFREMLDPQDSVQVVVLENEKDQAVSVAESIKKNLQDDELEPSDILVIFPDPLTVMHEAKPLREALRSAGLSSHVAGITSSRDELFLSDSIAISGIYRAKGNEAPMVYVMNSQYCYSGPELIKRRNTLFTAITRSRAWVRICGYGQDMANLKKEIDRVVGANYELDFLVPSAEQLAKLRKVYRDITDDERDKLRSLEEVVELIDKGELSIESIAKETLDKLRRQLG